MTTLTGIHVDALTTDGNDHKREALASLRSSYEAKHRHILTEAKAKVLKLSRDAMCEDFNVGCEERSDDEGGGSITLTFPPDWHTDQAERFATEFLDLDLCERGYTPGAYFQRGGVGRSNTTGEVIISMSWGYDI